MLSRIRGGPVAVFAVWEPILITDWRAPGHSVLGRLTDPRVKQFWDPGHLVAKQLAQDARPPQPRQECCTRGGFLWDLAAVYAPGAMWTETMPAAAFFNGTVVDSEAAIEAAIRKWQK